MIGAKELNEKLEKMDVTGLIDQLWYCGCEPYKEWLWVSVMTELERRIEEDEL